MGEKEKLTEKEMETETEEIVKIPLDAEDALTAAKRSADEFRDMAQRIQAEFENFRKRNAESVRVARKEGIDDVILSLLPVLDNFERAMENLKGAEKSGVELIFRQLLSILTKFGVEEIPALEQPFDPKYHHAIAQCECGEGDEANTVTEVFQKGYKRTDKVLRAAMVKVSQ